MKGGKGGGGEDEAAVRVVLKKRGIVHPFQMKRKRKREGEWAESAPFKLRRKKEKRGKGSQGVSAMAQKEKGKEIGAFVL